MATQGPENTNDHRLVYSRDLLFAYRNPLQPMPLHATPPVAIVPVRSEIKRNRSICLSVCKVREG